MIGWVYVMTPADYAAWLASGKKTQSMVEQGAQLFTRLGCPTCHVAEGAGRAPSLVGLYGKTEKLATGETRVVDESLMRQAILSPNSILLPNYAPIMPTYKGQMDEEQLLELIAYVKSLAPQQQAQERNQP